MRIAMLPLLPPVRPFAGCSARWRVVVRFEPRFGIGSFREPCLLSTSPGGDHDPVRRVHVFDGSACLFGHCRIETFLEQAITGKATDPGVYDPGSPRSIVEFFKTV